MRLQTTYTYIKTLLIGVIASTFVACDDKEQLGVYDNIVFGIDATLVQQENESRAVFSDADEINVTQYCILIYDGTTSSSKLVHYQDLSSLPAEIILPKSPGMNTYRAILIGNASMSKDGFANCKTIGVSTLADLNNATFPVSSHYSIPGNTSGTMNPDGNALASAAINFTWSGHKDFTGNDKTLSFNLNPNMAKMKIAVNNNTLNKVDPNDKIRTISMQIKNVRNKVLFAQNALSDCGLYSESSSLGITSYNTETLALEPGQSKTRTYYIPHNQVDTGGKSRPNAPTNATYIEVVGERQTDYLEIAYKIYPGTKTNDGQFDGNYHILSDYQYNVTIDINSDGVKYSGDVVTPDDNKSVEPHKKISLPKGSNCYMIHPKLSRISKSETIVYELPIDRVNEYWGNDGITDNSIWYAYVIWQDIPQRAMYFTNESGTAKNDYFQGKGKQPIYFKLADSYNNISSSPTADNLKLYGNIVIGLTTEERGNYKDNQHLFKWSWHLWVTDYNPDAAPSHTDATKSPYNNSSICGLSAQNYNSHVIDSQGFWIVGNSSPAFYGNVQHYNRILSEWNETSSKNVWDGSGIYANKWIMDRYLGADHPSNGDGSVPADGFGLYYQFGRKDPFSYHPTYYIDATARSSRWSKVSYQAPNLSYGVMNANTFYIKEDGSWSQTITSNPWYSPNAVKKGAKTLFDPCPPGWCVPVTETFDFATKSTGSTIYNNDNKDYSKYAATFSIYFSQVSIERHMAVMTSVGSYGSTNKHLDSTFPIQGYISGTTGDLMALDFSKDTRGCLWVVEPKGGYGYLYQMQPDGTYRSSDRKGNGVNIYSGKVTLQAWSASRGQNIRCVQEPD